MKLRLFILFFCATGTVLILQSAFDSSDHKKTERAVQNYSVGGRQLGPWLEQRTPGGAWSTEITHGCRGVVRARYTVSLGAKAASYEFDYDVPGHTIHPANEMGKSALEAFTVPVEPPRPSPSPVGASMGDGGTSHD